MNEKRRQISAAPASNRRRLANLLLPLILPALLPVALYPQSRPDAALARAYTRIAAEIADGNGTEALGLIEAAVEFDPGYSQALFLKARILYTDEPTSSLQEVKELIEGALHYDNWAVGGAADAKMVLARVYDQLRLYQRQLELLYTVDPTRRTAADWYYLTARACLFTGKTEAARKLLEEAGRLFPGDSTIQGLRIKYDSRYRAYLNRAVLDPRRPEPEESILAALILNGQEDLQALVDRYLELGYEELPVLLRMAALGLAPEEWNATELLDRDDLERRESLILLTRLFSDSSEPESVAAFEEFRKDLTAGLGEDSDRDGYEDRFYLIEAGRLVEYSVDSNQDRVNEIELLFSDGTDPPSPAELRYRDRRQQVRIEYTAYPEVEQIEITAEEHTSSYRFAPASFLLDPVTAVAWPPSVELVLPLILDRARLEALSYSHRIEASADAGDSDLQELQVGRVSRYSVDNQSYIERDFDGNGYAEVREIYRDGRLVLLEFDQEENGIYEYRYRPVSGREEWDFDQDGTVDYERITREKGLE